MQSVQNVVKVKSIFDMRLAAYSAFAKGEKIEAFIAESKDYYSLLAAPEAPRAFLLDNGHLTIFGIPFKMEQDDGNYTSR